MKSRIVFRLAIIGALAFGSAMSAQGQLLPSYPKLGFGASITPAYDGWYDKADGSHVFVIGYYNRNWNEEVDIPIGPDNHFEPGEPDRGQPTHFLPNRNFGMFSITVPKNTPPTERIWWVLTLNGVTQRVPFHMSPDYNFSPLRASEESPNGKYNVPPILKFTAAGPGVQGPVGTIQTALAKTATVKTPMPLELFAEDDSLYASGTNAPLGRVPALVEATVAKYRGPGTVTVDGLHEFETTKGGKLLEPYAGRTHGTISFSAAGDYIVHITLNDLSEKGGGATGCCWTTAMLKVNVKGGAAATTTGQQ
jgi:hypothetical protein